MRIGAQLADVLAELPYRRGPGARRGYSCARRRGVDAADNRFHPAPMNCLRRSHYFRDKSLRGEVARPHEPDQLSRAWANGRPVR